MNFGKKQVATLISGRAAQSAKKAESKLKKFSKCWEMGGTYHVIMPIFWNEEDQRWDLLVGHSFGHMVEYEAYDALNFKRSWIPTDNEVTFNDSGMAVISKVGLLEKFSRVAGKLRTFLYQSQVEKVTEESVKDTKMLLARIAKLQKEFNIPKNQDFSPSPLSSMQLRYCTEAVVVKTKDQTGAFSSFDFNNINLCYINIGKDLANKIEEVLTSEGGVANHVQVGKDFYYVELIVNFPAKENKAQSAMAAVYSDLEPEHRLIDSVALSEAWENPNFKTKMEQVDFDSDIIIARNPEFTPVEASRIESTLSLYAASLMDQYKPDRSSWIGEAQDVNKFLPEKLHLIESKDAGYSKTQAERADEDESENTLHEGQILDKKDLHMGDEAAAALDEFEGLEELADE